MNNSKRKVIIMKKSAGSIEKKIVIASIGAVAGLVFMVGGVVARLNNKVPVVTMEDFSEPHPLVEVKPYEAKAGMEVVGEAVSKNNKNQATSSQQIGKAGKEVPESQSQADTIAEKLPIPEKTEPNAMQQSQSETFIKSGNAESQSIPHSSTPSSSQASVTQNTSAKQKIIPSAHKNEEQSATKVSDSLSVPASPKDPEVPVENKAPSASEISAEPKTPAAPEVPPAPSVTSGHYEIVVISPEQTVYDVEEFNEPIMGNFSVFYDFDGNILKMIPSDDDAVVMNTDGSVSGDPVGEYALYVVQNHLGRGNWFVEKHQTGNIQHDAMEGISEEEFKDYKNSLKSRKGLVYKKRTIPAVTEEVWVEDK